MPIYSIRNNKTGEIWEEMMSWSSLQEYLEANPEFESIITKAPGLVAATGDRTKVDGGFKELLGRIADQNPTSALADDYGRKDAKSVAVRDVVKKVKKRIGGDISSSD